LISHRFPSDKSLGYFHVVRFADLKGFLSYQARFFPGTQLLPTPPCWKTSEMRGNGCLPLLPTRKLTQRIPSLFEALEKLVLI
jgi:hypothetical protein